MNKTTLMTILASVENFTNPIIRGRDVPEIFVSIPHNHGVPEGWEMVGQQKGYYPKNTIRIKYIG